MEVLALTPAPAPAPAPSLTPSCAPPPPTASTPPSPQHPAYSHSAIHRTTCALRVPPSHLNDSTRTTPHSHRPVLHTPIPTTVHTPHLHRPVSRHQVNAPGSTAALGSGAPTAFTPPFTPPSHQYSHLPSHQYSCLSSLHHPHRHSQVYAPGSTCAAP